MKTIDNKRLGERCYTLTLENGLDIILWEKKDFRKSFYGFATNFGALGLKEEVDGNEVEFHSGVAHFLEHKMFENEDNSDVMSRFTEMGCNVNAFTSYNETLYYFTTTRVDIEEPVNLLLDFVQQFSVSELSVDKEKGIIDAEYKMYQQSVSSRLIHGLFEAMYHNNPINKDISGDSENIMAITKEELELAHKYNYHPNNMLFVGVTNQDVDKLVELIKENQNRKEFPKIKDVKLVMGDEPKSVKEEFLEIKMNLNQPKIAMGYKLNLAAKNNYEFIKFDILFKLFVAANFTSTNSIYQQWMDDKLITDSFMVESDITSEAELLFLLNDFVSDDWVKVMDDYLHSLKENPITEEVLNQIKKRFVGKFIREFDQVEDIAINSMRAHWLALKLDDYLEIIENIKLEDFKIFKNVDFSNRSIVKIV